MVRLNDVVQLGDHWQMMNVLFIQARSKLIIFGKTLQSTSLLFVFFFTLMDVKTWILSESLPPHADKMYSHAVL
ncbi:hypothetical protein PILCRDRAFT_827572 [Piloderma croceum F 1598]|uniref:Uncharacterized protein n=1 Tax=Piloderma croceum (strain F 1598) TaxID=765440 RepID=A0A0C3F5L0_PILCF|nr:hypothetical protein PILCRDRAFT_827572 [Piloderma croceum F 1598]